MRILLAALFAVVIGATSIGAKAFAAPPPMMGAPASAAIDSFLTIDGIRGQNQAVVAKHAAADGQMGYFLTFNLRSAVVGTYSCANGQHITVIGPNGRIDISSFSWGVNSKLWSSTRAVSSDVLLPYSWPLAISIPVALTLKGKAITSNAQVGCYLLANAQIDGNTYTGAPMGAGFVYVPFKLPLPKNELSYNGTLNLSMTGNGSESQPPVQGNEVWCHLQIGGPSQYSVRLILPPGAPSKLMMPLFSLTLD